MDISGARFVVGSTTVKFVGFDTIVSPHASLPATEAIFRVRIPNTARRGPVAVTTPGGTVLTDEVLITGG
jgi:hypothetical protein